MTRSEARSVAAVTPVVLGLVTLVSGVAAGLFSDLRLLGKIVGLAALVLWIVALGSLLFRLGRDNELPLHVWTATLGAFILTAALIVIALQTGPRLSSRVLILSERGQRIVSGLCEGPMLGRAVPARIALSQLDSAYVHIELRDGRCSRGNGDVRIRSDDLLAVLPDS
jgi:hypothetical protein